jgi:hypothetical protein
MTARKHILVNLGLWIVIAILLYFLVEMFHPLKPLEITVGDLIIPARNIVFVMLVIFISIRLCFVLRK